MSSDRHAEIGGRLRSAREASGRSQAEAASLLGVAQTSVSALERGLYLPDEPLLRRLVEVYDLAPDGEAWLRERVRAARRLRGAAAGEGDASWPVDPGSVTRRAWCGELRRSHRLTRDELAAQLGVKPNAIAKLEQDGTPLPLPLKEPTVLQRLALLGETDELDLRLAWQPDEVEGIEHLVGSRGRASVDAARGLGELLRWVLATGTTQSAIAAACGVSRPAVHQWLTGQTSPSPERLHGLADLLGVDASALTHLAAADR